MTSNRNSELQIDAAKRRSRRALVRVFSVIWIVAMAIAVITWHEPPVYLLVVATVFFFMLVPSMVDLVQDYDRFIDWLQRRTDAPDAASGPRSNSD